MSNLACPLCNSTAVKTAVAARVPRPYWHCSQCQLIFMAAEARLSLAQERDYYGTHQNSIADQGYVAFLQRLLTPMLPFLTPQMQGLDFGCGPGPTLSAMLAAQGIACDDYDPVFFPIPLRQHYHFITASECFEHFHHPALELARLSELLLPGGFLGVMTERWQSEAQFFDWHYSRDPTHCSFFHRRSFDWICGQYGLKIVAEDANRVVILQKLP